MRARSKAAPPRAKKASQHERRAKLASLLGDAANRERELREALRLYTQIGATGHAERVGRELEL